MPFLETPILWEQFDETRINRFHASADGENEDDIVEGENNRDDEETEERQSSFLVLESSRPHRKKVIVHGMTGLPLKQGNRKEGTY